MKAYKGFNKDMTCRGFQFKEGETYTEDKAELCKSGFHACLNPLDCWNYYNLISSEFHEVELEDVSDEREDDTKVCAKKITIGAKLDIKGLVKASVDFVMESVKDCFGKSNDNGDYARIGSSGNYAQIGSSGDYARIGSSGYYAQIGSSGDSAQIGSSGNYAQIGSSGNYAQIGSSGNYAQIGSSGYYAQIGSSGDSARIDMQGERSVAACVGHDGKIKGTLGSWIVLTEWAWVDDKYTPICVKAAQIDGENLKPGIWYGLENGKFVEAD